MSSEKASTIEHWEENKKFAHECLRYRSLLYQVAERILRGPECAEEAVNRTLTLTTRVSHRKMPAGEFRSWLLRLLIEEALLLRRKRMARETQFANPVLPSGNISGCSDSMASLGTLARSRGASPPPLYHHFNSKPPHESKPFRGGEGAGKQVRVTFRQVVYAGA